MTTATILSLIDLQNGFDHYDLTDAEGGCLYVPEGEKAAARAADLMRSMSNGFIVLSQDFHPKNHISFMTNHPGVMEWRKDRLRQQGVPEAELDAAVLNPVKLPFDDILLKQGVDGRYRAIACGVGREWRAVDTDKNGYITGIRDHEISTREVLGALRQRLWSPHCKGGSQSALFSQPIMDELPPDLVEALHKDVTSPVLKSVDARGNTIIVVRKGMRSDLDSYGIATENDGVSRTHAPEVFAEIATMLKDRGVTHVKSYIGGLAKNFCLELSDNDMHNLFFPLLEVLHIDCTPYLLTDVSYGIPVKVRGGAWPDLDNCENRMLAKGKQATTTGAVIRAGLAGRSPAPAVQPAP